MLTTLLKIKLFNFLFNFNFLKKFLLKFLTTKLNVDFVDFGSKNGGSISYAKKIFGLNRGIGIDILNDFTTIAFKNKFLGIKTNILHLPDLRLFNGVIMSHFLEHIPSRDLTFKMIEKSLNISNTFVYIQQPFFDENLYLFHNKLKFACADWHGHPNMLTTYDFFIILNRLQKKYNFNFSIFYDHLIKDSSSTDIVNLEEPTDTILYTSSCLKKKIMKFDRPVYKEIKLLITHSDINHSQYVNKIKYEHVEMMNINP